MSDHTSERTPDSGHKALEDIQPEHGALVRPQGPPISLGPQVNPFWSEAAREEAILRACRPAHLPPESQDGQQPQVSSMSPPREPPEAFRTVMHSLLQENARLWSEREALAAHHGAWGPHPGGFGQQQSWFGSVLGEGMGHERKEGDKMMAKLTSEQWKQHVMNDHLPYSRECPTCLQGSGRSCPHKKVQRPDALTLSVDICGPFRPGHDRLKKAKYFMVGVFSIPVRKIEGKITPLPLCLEETRGAAAEEEKPELEELVPVLEEVEPEAPEVKLEVEAEDIEIQNYTMVETLESRQVAEVKTCLARMVARLKYLGLDVRRVHSDAAGEMRGTKKWCQDRGLYRTFTCGSDWKANGRAEAEIGVIRRAINTLIRSSGDGEDYWPLMAKHVGERRGRQQLASLGFVTPQLLPWGQRVMITTKGWDDFQGHWRARKKPGVVRGPDPDMSLTSGGHLVEVENGNFIRTDDMVPVDSFETKDVVELAVRDQPADLLDRTVKPRRRLTEKTSLARIGGGEIQRRLMRGQEWANEEFKKLESQMAEDGNISIVADMDSENALKEDFLQESEAVVKRLEVEAVVSEAEGEENKRPFCRRGPLPSMRCARRCHFGFLR